MARARTSRVTNKGRASKTTAQGSAENPHDYIPYPAALAALRARLAATAEELAAWVFLGEEEGGLNAYVAANELPEPPRSRFHSDMDVNFVAGLAPTWFRRQDIEEFSPTQRFLSGAWLELRWQEHLKDAAREYIVAKVRESRLLDVHPVAGFTQASGPDEHWRPPVEDGLYEVALIEAIEREDFGLDTPDWRVQSSSNDRYRQAARMAINARHDAPGGSREKVRRIREIWAQGKYTSRNRCAEEECGALGMALSTARKALVGTPDP